MWFDETGIEFVPPSPSMISISAAINYAGFCLFEGTNLSLGRGSVDASYPASSVTHGPFEMVAAPWLDSERLIEKLNPLAKINGIALSSYKFTPREASDGKYEGISCNAVTVKIIDRARYDPISFAIAAIGEIQRLHPEEFKWNAKHFDLLAGGSLLRQTISKNKPVESLLADWTIETNVFKRECNQLDCVLYDGFSNRFVSNGMSVSVDEDALEITQPEEKTDGEKQNGE